jgi:hypothetical protein
LQATDHLGFETAHVIRSFVSQATMKFFRKANADHPTPGVLHPPKASDASPNGDPDNQSGHGGKGDGHGDTPAIRNRCHESCLHRSRLAYQLNAAVAGAVVLGLVLAVLS